MWCERQEKEKALCRAQWRELHRGGVHAIAQTGGIGAIRKDMAQVGVAEHAFHFAAEHAQTEVVFLADVFGRNGFPEAGPTRS